MNDAPLQESILKTLRSLPQKCTVATLAAIKKKSRENIDKCLLRLHKKGLVQRAKFFDGRTSKSVWHYWAGRGRP